MSAKSEGGGGGGGGGLMGNHVPHRPLPTVHELGDEDDELEDEDSPETSSTPPDDVTAVEEGQGRGLDDDDVDEPMAMSSSEVTLSDHDPVKDAVPDGPTAGGQPPTSDTATPGQTLLSRDILIAYRRKFYCK